MERRLVPVNAAIALCVEGDSYPAPLAAIGFQLAGIEVPVTGAGGTVVVDVVAFKPSTNTLLAIEAKSGANIDERQAGAYAAISADALIEAASITLGAAGSRNVQSIVVCLAEHKDRILQGLAAAQVDPPVLAVDDAQIEHLGAHFHDPTVEAAFLEPLQAHGPPPRIIPVDADSPPEAFDALVMPALVAAMAQRRPEVTVTRLAEDAMPHIPLYGKKERNRLEAKVDEAARRIVHRDPGSFEYLPRTDNRDRAVIRILRNPEDAALQGRTQGYQGIARRARPRPRPPRQENPDQMAFFEIVSEFERAAGELAPPADDDDEEGER